MARFPWRQTWSDLAFFHWSVPVVALRPWVPEVLEIRQREGVTWIGVVPFRMEGVGWGRLPGLPGHTNFPEINVRLYVEYQGRPGVWFLSLEAPPRLVVWAARRFFGLPYSRSQVDLVSTAGVAQSPAGAEVRVASCRLPPQPALTLRARYGPVGPVAYADPGTLERWLTDLLRLYSVRPDGSLWEAEVEHGPWPLQPAEATLEANDLLSPYGLDLAPLAPEHVLFSRRLPVRMTPLRPVAP